MIAPSTAKAIARWGLLLFAGFSMVWVFAKDAARGSATEQSASGRHDAMAQIGDSAAPSPSFALIYFHGNLRCKTCRAIESFSRQTATTSLAPEIDSGFLQFQVINFDDPPNRHYIDDFELPGSSLVLVRMANGVPEQYVALQDVWYLADEPEQFQTYVAGEVRNFMTAGEIPHD